MLLQTASQEYEVFARKFCNLIVLKGKGVMDDYCKNKYLEISRIPSDADMHTRNFHFHAMELSGTLY